MTTTVTRLGFQGSLMRWLTFRITEAADVGFGSFYNHFESKEALFEAAVRSTVEDWAILRDQIVARTN